MLKMMLATAAAVTMFAAAPSFVASTSAQADGIKLAQVDLDVNVGRPREHDRVIRERRDRDVDVTVGRHIGPRNCRTVTTFIDRDGRHIKRTERQCD